MAQTWLTFQFRNDPSYWDLDDVSVTNAGGTQQIVNGGFETGSLSSWTKGGTQGLTNSASVQLLAAHTGTYAMVDGSVNGTDGIYQGFTTVAGQTYTISFWLADNGSTTGTASSYGLALVQIGANVLGTTPLSITGAAAGQTMMDTGTIAPFSGVTLTDGNGGVDTVVVTSGTLNGTLSATVGGAVSNGTYTATGSLSVVQADLQALVFTPTAHQVAAGGTVQTAFTIALSDTVGAVPASNTATSVIVTDTAQPPTISGAVAGQTMTDSGTIAAFSGVTLADVNTGPQTETLTVTSASLNGALSDSVGGTISNGTYTAIGSLSAVQADLQALVFTPTAHQVAPGGTVQTGFTIGLVDTAGGTASNTATSVIVTANNNAPVITGATLGQTVTLDGNIAAFSTITITDPAAGAKESVTIVLTDGGVATDADGTLAGTNLTHTAVGTYVLTTGTPAAVTSLLDSLQFSSTVSANATAVTVFTITVADNHGTSGTVTASVTATDVGTPGGLALAASGDSGIVGDNTTDITTPMIVGTGYAGDTITLYDGTVAVGSGTVGSGGSWSVAAGTLATGAHTLTATQADPAGRNSATSSALTVTVVPVPVAPGGLTLSPASDSGTRGDNTTDITTPTITGTGSVGDTITLYDGTIAVGSGTVGQGGTWSVTSSALGTGAQTLTATQTDPYGDISAASTPLGVTIVAVPNAPTALALTAASDSGIQGDNKTDITTPTITGTGSVGDTITLYDGTVDLGSGVVGQGGTWSIATGTLGPGAHTLTATQTDTHGDISAASSTLAVTILAPPAAPGAPTLSPASDSGTQGDNSTDVTTPTLTGTGSVGDIITLYDGTIAVGSGTVGSSGTWSIATGTLATGRHDLGATQTDQSGDISAASSTLAVTIVAVPSAPTGLALAPASDSGIQGDNKTDITTPTITGTGSVGDTITLYDGTIAVGSGTVGSGGIWSVTSGTLGPGAQTLTATQTDAGGDISAASSTLAVTIVAMPSAPTGLTLSPASDSGTQGDNKTDVTTPTITGGGTVGDTVVLYDGATSVGSGVVASSGTWSIATGTLAGGAHPFSATQIDQYGDISASSATLDVTITATPSAPGTITLSPASDSGAQGDGITDDTTPTLAGTGTPGDTIILYDGTISVGSAVVNQSGSWSITSGTLGLGNAMLSAVQVDAGGDISSASSTLDLTIVPVPAAPGGLTLSPASDSGVQGDDSTDITTPTITGTGTAGDTITLYDGTIAVGSGTVAGNGTWAITTGTLGIGAHPLTATQADPHGDLSPSSGTLDVTIAAPPSAPGAPTLSASSDSGAQGDGVTDDTTPTLTGTGTPGDTITLYDGTIAVGSAVVNQSGSWSITSGTLGVGVAMLSATDTNAAGNVSPASGTLDLTIVAIPAAPGGLTLSPASDSGVQGDDSTDITTPTITGTGTAGDTITLYDGTIAVGSGTVAGNGTWAITTGTLGIGAHPLTATQADPHGDLSPSSGTLDVTIAAPPSAPGAPTLSASSDSGAQGDGITDDTTPTLTGTGAPGDTITLYDGTISVGSAVVNQSGSWSITTSTLGVGVAMLSATDTNAAGNVSPASGTLDLTIAPVPAAPGALTLAPASDTGIKGDNQTDDTTPTITGTGTAGDTVILYDGATSVGSAVVGSNGTWSVTSGTLGVGTHTLTATESDPHGDISPTSATLDVTIGAPPATPGGLTLAASSDSGTKGDNVTDDTTPTITGTGIAGETIVLHDGTITVGSTVVSQSGTWAITTSPLANGLNPLSASQIDQFGNLSTASATLNLTIAPTPAAPGAPTLSPASDSGAQGDGITDVTTPTITGTGTAGDTITLYDGTVTVGSAVVNQAGGWSIVTGTLAGGAHTLTATQTDPYGDISAASSTLAVTIVPLPAAPGGLTLSPASDSGTQGDDKTEITTPTITGGGTVGDTVVLYDGATSVGSGTVASNGTWSITTGTLVTGVHPFTARQADQHGDLSPVSGTLDVTIAAPPSAPGTITLSPASDSGAQGDGITDATTPTLTGTGTPGDTITLYDGTITVGSAVVNQSGGWSITSGTLGVGVAMLSATDTDAAGDVSPASGTLDLTIVPVPAAPGGLTLSPASDSGVPGDDSTDITTPTITGTGTAGDTVYLYDGATTIGTAVVGGDGTWSIAPGTLSLGVHPLTAAQADQHGDLSPASGTLDLTIAADPSAPGTLALSPASDSGVQGDGTTDVMTPTITGTGTAGDTITLYDGATSVGSGVVAQDGAWSIVTDPLGVGMAVLTATDTDPAGDASAPSGTLDLTIVAVPDAPANLAMSPASDSGIQGDGTTDITTPTITGTGIAGDTVILYDGATSMGSAVVDSTGTWSVVTGTLAAGMHPFTATQTDALGDISPTSSTLDVTITATPAEPGAPTLSASSDSGVQNDNITNDTTPDIIGTGVAGDTITLYDGTTSIGSAVVGQDGSWSINTGSLADGTHQLTDTQTDQYGDTSAAAGPTALTIASSAAAPTIMDQPAASTNASQPVVGGQTADDGIVTIYQDGAAIGTAVANDAGVWSFDFPAALANGSYSITAMVQDVAGNISPLSGTVTVQISDTGYSAVDPPDSAGHVKSSYFDTDGAVTQVDTANSGGELLQSVSNTQALLEIYDGFGKLIGTVTQPSNSALSQPGFTTTGQGLTAVTNTTTVATVITLLDEQNILYTHGNDTIDAGSGTDTIVAGGTSTSVAGGTGNLVLVTGSGTSMVNGGSGSATVFGGTGGSIQGGTAGKNVLVAVSGTTTLVGGGSGDTYVAGGGNALVLMRPNGLAFGGGGTSTIFGAGNATMVGGSGSGSNVMVGDATTGDLMFGGAGTTTMFGGGGNDTMVGGSGQTVMVLGAGNDVVAGGSGGTTVYGGSGNDLYFATGGGTMDINEGSGSDQLVLGNGAATMTGGGGTDVYYVANGSAGGTDVINGFKVGTDQLRLFGYPAADATPTFSGGNAVFSLSDGTRITLVGVSSLVANSVV